MKMNKLVASLCAATMLFSGLSAVGTATAGAMEETVASSAVADAASETAAQALTPDVSETATEAAEQQTDDPAEAVTEPAETQSVAAQPAAKAPETPVAAIAEPTTQPVTTAPVTEPVTSPAATYITLNKTALSLGINETFTLTVKTDAKSCTFTSSAPAVATVNNAGVLKPKACGKTTITCKTANGLTAACALTVGKQATSVTLNKTTVTLTVGASLDIDATVPKGEAAYYRAFTTNNPQIISVKTNGVVTGLALGTAVVTCTLKNGVRATCTVNVVEATDIKLSKNSLTMGLNETFRFQVTTDATKYFLNTRDNSIATISKDGKLKPKKTGKTMVIAMTTNGLFDICDVEIKKEAKTVTLNKTSLKLGIGETFDLNSTVGSGTAAYYREFISDNTKVARVTSASGIVKGMNAGTANIYCLLSNGVLATCKVTVGTLAKSVTLNAASVKLGVGESFDFNSYVPSGTYALSRDYYSNSAAVAKIVKNSGVVTGVKAGTTKIYCQLSNGVRAYATVTVYNAPKTVKLNKTTATVSVGSTLSLTATIDKNTYSGTYKWTSSKPAVLSVSSAANGKASFKAMKQGTSIVTVKTFNGLKATCTVTVAESKIKCIDISYWQGKNVDFKKVKASGIDYVIIRSGYSETKDSYFEDNYTRAKKAGLKVGTYWYMYASNKTEAVDEAKACLEAIKGKTFDLPVFYDVEEEPVLENTSQKVLTNMCVGFCDLVKKAGYKVGVYSGPYEFIDNEGLNYDLFVKNGYYIWNAEWDDNCSIVCDIWQYADDGKVNGIDGNVDMSYILNLNML